jgi:hypothetical protein
MSRTTSASARPSTAAASDLDAAIGRVVLEDENARPGVSAEVPRLHVVSARDDVEAAVSPAVPGRREEHVAVGAVGREDGDEGTLEQPVEVVAAEALPHRGESSRTWHVDNADPETATRARSSATRARRTVSSPREPMRTKRPRTASPTASAGCEAVLEPSGGRDLTEACAAQLALTLAAGRIRTGHESSTSGRVSTRVRRRRQLRRDVARSRS